MVPWVTIVTKVCLTKSSKSRFLLRRFSSDGIASPVSLGTVQPGGGTAESSSLKQVTVALNPRCSTVGLVRNTAVNVPERNKVPVYKVKIYS